MRTSRTARPATAFTLIEAILAIAIFATVLAAVNAVFFGGIRLRERVTLAAEEALPRDRAVAMLKRDLSAILPPNTNYPVALAGAMSSDTTAPGISQTVALEIYTASGILTDDKPWGDIQRIDYALQPPTNRFNAAGRDLVRNVSRNLLPTSTDLPEQQTLLEDVQNLKFTYFDGTNWLDSWSVTLSNIPQAIRVAIDFAVNPQDSRVRAPIRLMVPVLNLTLTNISMVATN